ncbi:MAG: PTS sugar transporter subunit IIB [Deltaproteobacteria bacterium]|nr:PTS sugar transporter subunit IIB [Deltaproteobacteria bacterium]
MVILVRVDDRLLHGQIICSWVPFTKADSLVVASDEAAGDELTSEIMCACGCEGLTVRVEKLSEAATRIGLCMSCPDRVIMIVSDVRDAMRLYELGMRFASLNLGNIHHEKNGRTITPSVIVNGEDEKILDRFKLLGVEIDIRDVPTKEPVEYVSRTGA